MNYIVLQLQKRLGYRSGMVRIARSLAARLKGSILKLAQLKYPNITRLSQLPRSELAKFARSAAVRNSFKAGIAALAIAETAFAVYCSYKCNKDPCYNQ